MNKQTSIFKKNCSLTRRLKVAVMNMADTKCRLSKVIVRPYIISKILFSSELEEMQEKNDKMYKYHIFIYRLTFPRYSCTFFALPQVLYH